MFKYIENIKLHYAEITPYIMKRQGGHWFTPYTDLVDWETIFSPIEKHTWNALRSFGHCPLYPQYPVDKYFLDFGNPKVKVAIECDGKEWHLNKEKDAKRDKELLENGWHVYRISGSDCTRFCERYWELLENHYLYEDQQDEILEEYYTTIEGLIKAISFYYFGYKDYFMFEDEINIALRALLKYISPVQENIVSDILFKKDNEIRTEYYEFIENN